MVMSSVGARWPRALRAIVARLGRGAPGPFGNGMRMRFWGTGLACALALLWEMD